MRRALTQKITRTRLRAFLERHKTDKKVLDIGCSVAAYKKYFPNSTGVDIDETKNPDVVGDAHALPFKDNEFEVVLCTEVFEHLHSPHIAASEMRRVLKPGGTLVLTTRFIYPIHDAPHDYFRYTKYGLQHIFKDWDIIELEAETNTMEALAVLYQTLAQKVTFRGGVVTKGLFLLRAWLLACLSWLIVEERTSGRHGPKRVEVDIMSSGYYLVCKNTK